MGWGLGSQRPRVTPRGLRPVGGDDKAHAGQVRIGRCQTSQDLVGPGEGLDLCPAAVGTQGRDWSREETWGERAVRRRLLR